MQKEENGLMRGKEDMESGSGSEQIVEENTGIEMESNIDCNNNIIHQNQKKKRYHRHTARQIQEMEAYISLSLFFFSSFFNFEDQSLFYFILA